MKKQMLVIVLYQILLLQINGYETEIYPEGKHGIVFDQPGEEKYQSNPHKLGQDSDFIFQTSFQHNFIEPKFYDANKIIDEKNSGLLATVLNGENKALQIQYIFKSSYTDIDQQKDHLLITFYNSTDSTSAQQYPLFQTKFYPGILQSFKTFQLIASYSNANSQETEGKLYICLKDEDGNKRDIQYSTLQVKFNSLYVRIGKEIFAGGKSGFSGYVGKTTFSIGSSVRTISDAETLFYTINQKPVKDLKQKELVSYQNIAQSDRESYKSDIGSLEDVQEFTIISHFKKNESYSKSYQTILQASIYENFEDVDDKTLFGVDMFSVQIMEGQLRIKLLATYDYHKGGFQHFNEEIVQIPLLDSLAWFTIRLSINNKNSKGKYEVKFPSTVTSKDFQIFNANPNNLYFQFGNNGNSNNAAVGEIGQTIFYYGDKAYDINSTSDQLSSFYINHVCNDEFNKLHSWDNMKAVAKYENNNDLSISVTLNTLENDCFTVNAYYESENGSITNHTLPSSKVQGTKVFSTIIKNPDAKFEYYTEDDDDFYYYKTTFYVIVRQQGFKIINKNTIPYVFIKKVDKFDETKIKLTYTKPKCESSQDAKEKNCISVNKIETQILELNKKGEIIQYDSNHLETKVMVNESIGIQIQIQEGQDKYYLKLVGSTLELKENNQDGYKVVESDFIDVSTVVKPDNLIDTNGWIKFFWTPANNDYYQKDVQLVFKTEIVREEDINKQRILQDENSSEETKLQQIRLVTTLPIKIIDPTAENGIHCQNQNTKNCNYCEKTKENKCLKCTEDTRDLNKSCKCKSGYTDKISGKTTTECHPEDTQNLEYLAFIVLVPVFLGIGFAARHFYKKRTNSKAGQQYQTKQPEQSESGLEEKTQKEEKV